MHPPINPLLDHACPGAVAVRLLGVRLRSRDWHTAPAGYFAIYHSPSASNQVAFRRFMNFGREIRDASFGESTHATGCCSTRACRRPTSANLVKSLHRFMACDPCTRHSRLLVDIVRGSLHRRARCQLRCRPARAGGGICRSHSRLELPPLAVSSRYRSTHASRTPSITLSTIAGDRHGCTASMAWIAEAALGAVALMGVEWTAPHGRISCQPSASPREVTRFGADT